MSKNQKFGNMFSTFLGMFCVFAVVMFFYEGCSYQRNSIVVDKEDPKEESFNPSDWIIFK